jgi:dehydrogenase/reductase SDR family protein X
VIEYFTFCSSDPMNRREEYAIITGGNRGLGFYTLLGLQASGMKVIAGTKQVFF